jgi:hypothetical protein
MKKVNPLLISLLLFCNLLAAQHCPFDGSYIVVIKLTDANGNIITSPDSTFFLTETLNPLADSCTYAEGQLNLLFDIPSKSLVKKYEGSWEKRAALYLEECTFKQSGYFVVVLNQAQHHCMVNRNNEFTYLDRHFEIRQKTTTGTMLLSVVPTEKIYPLCTANGKWSRIKAIEVKSTEE